MRNLISFTYKHKHTQINGLYIVNNFISDQTATGLIKQSNSLLEYMKKSVKDYSGKQITTNIPQPKEIKSHKHNLSSEEKYIPLSINENNHIRKFEYFQKYGDEGHELVYFRGNENIPNDFYEITNNILDINEIKELGFSKNINLNWKMTINHYNKNINNSYSGFPFHVDLPANGEFTCILSLCSYGIIEFKEMKNENNSLYKFIIYPRSLIILSNESRWNYMHRVIPTNDSFEFEGKSI